MSKGILYGVGVGPGDPELLTRKAARILREADVIAVPATGEGRQTALAIVADEIEGKTLLDTNAPQYDLVMMFGDAPQDYKECKQANKKLGGSEEKPVRMFFIEAGRENETWKFYCDNVLDKFVSNTWSVEEEQKLINKGLANLDRVWDSGLAPIDTYAQRGEQN